MFECPCGFVCGHPDALREHRKGCMAAPAKPKEPEAECSGFEKWLIPPAAPIDWEP